jgi:hypothetical protein
MNKHFRDAWYYLRRAGNHLSLGVREELRPAEDRVRELTGREPAPTPTTKEQVRRNVRDAERRAERRARGAIGDARERIRVRTGR